jgi:hypothetical protein
MGENILHSELANFIYWVLTGLFLEIIFSMFYTISGGQLRSRSTGKFTGTRRGVVFITLLIGILYLSDRFLSELTTSHLESFEYALLPLAVFSVAFNAFYFVKVILDRKWRFSDTLSTLSISLISLAITIYMISNGNILIDLK